MRRSSTKLRKMLYNLRNIILNLRLKNLLLLITIVGICYLLLHRSTSHNPSVLFHRKTHIDSTAAHLATNPTSVAHLLFSVASCARSFPHRIPYIRLWYNPNSTRALVFVDRPIFTDTSNDHSIPPIIISGDTSKFPYTFKRGLPSAIRIARVVKEAVNRNEADVRWFVFGDDDTVFVPENLACVLSKYDHEKWYYVGSTSESLVQNVRNSFDMAFGGGGFAISSSLAKVLARVLDSCLMRYSHLYGSDLRIWACVSELGVGLTREPGFHQVDLRGDLFGMLTAHPLFPLLSLHHFDTLEPIFPNMSRLEAARLLFKAVDADPARTLQQTVCYDTSKNITVSVSWGYAIQVYLGNHLLPNILPWQRSFAPWKRGGVNNEYQYTIDTREYPRHPCQRAGVFFFKSLSTGSQSIQSVYTRDGHHKCFQSEEFQNLKLIQVSSQKLELDTQVGPLCRQCCDILDPLDESMLVKIRECGPEELIAMIS